MHPAIVFSVLAAAWTSFRAHRKGYNWLVWLLPGAGAVGIVLMLLVMPDLTTSQLSAEDRTKRRRRGNILGGILTFAGLLACALFLGAAHRTAGPTPASVSLASFAVHRATTEPTNGFQLHYLESPGERKAVYVFPAADLDEHDVASTSTVADSFGQSALKIQLTQAGAEKLAQFTALHQGQLMAIFVNGRLVSTPLVQAPVRNGSIEVPMFRVQHDTQKGYP